MKKIFVVLAFLLFGTASFAQWVVSPAGNLYETNTPGNVGIRNTAPNNDLDILDANGSATLVMNCTAVPTGTTTYTLGQYDMRFNGTTGTASFFRNVLRKNMVSGNIEMLQSLRNSAGLTLNFLWVDLNTAAFEMQSGISDASFKNYGKVYFNNFGGVGAVGIGTTSINPLVKLQVGGKIKCQEVEVAVTPWPDHVFKTGYNLMSLDEVASFVEANKHLPGVPSEEEVANNGVNVGEMNATLLQKVEELTLYMINLKKENDALKVRVSNLEK